MTAVDETPELADVLAGGRYDGVFPALVEDNQDPDGQGRVLVSLPWSPDVGGSGYRAWARLATLMAGNNRGTWFVPETGDEVLIAFTGGDLRWPVVLGGLWNGQDATPETITSRNDVRSITSREGIRITLDDTAGAVTLTLDTPGGQQVRLTDAGNQITISDTAGNSVQLAPGGITVSASGPLKMSAPTASLDVGMLTVSAGMSTFSGVVQVDTLIASSVVSASYTPGVGNIW